MKRIWKYPLEMSEVQYVEMPHGARILSAGLQGETICLWALVEPDNTPYRNMRIEIRGTGHPVNVIASDFVGTVQIGVYVWHVFAN